MKISLRPELIQSYILRLIKYIFDTLIKHIVLIAIRTKTYYLALVPTSSLYTVTLNNIGSTSM